MSPAATLPRPAAVAGMFYPGDAAKLEAEVHGYLASAQSSALQPKALIVPHAGYIYSAGIAASAYALLANRQQRIRRVVMLGPAHRLHVPGFALPPCSAFETPLGVVPVDIDSFAMLSAHPRIQFSEQAHAQEHSLEVQLPFLQCLLDDIQIVPILVGAASDTETAALIDSLWGGPETLLLVSSDLSHYLPYAMARVIDAKTCTSILQQEPLAAHEQACGATPINGLLEVARKRHMQVHLLAQGNSGDTVGDKKQVVGYAAFALTES